MNKQREENTMFAKLENLKIRLQATEKTADIKTRESTQRYLKRKINQYEELLQTKIKDIERPN